MILKGCVYFHLLCMDTQHTYLRDQIILHHRQACTCALGQLLKTIYVMVDQAYGPKKIIPNSYKSIRLIYLYIGMVDQKLGTNCIERYV